MLPQKDNQRDNGQSYRSEVQTKISGAIHIGVENSAMPGVLLARRGSELSQKPALPQCPELAFLFVL